MRVRHGPTAFLICLLLSAGISLHAQTRRQQRVLTRQTDIVYSTRFSPDGRTLAIARGATGTARVELWDVETGTLRHVISGFEGQVWSVSFAPDGKTLVTGSTEFHPSRIRPERGLPAGKHAAELKWWDAQTGELKQQVTMPGETQSTLMAFHSPDGKMLATAEYYYAFGSFKAEVKLLDAQTGELRRKVKHDLTVIEFSFARGFPDQLYILLNLRRQRLVVSPDSRFIAFWNSKETRLWDVATGEEVLKFNEPKRQVTAIAFAPVGDTLAVAILTSSGKKDNLTYQSEVRLYDAATRTVTSTLAPNAQVISSLAFPNQKQLMIGGWQTTARRPLAILELLDIQAGSLGTLGTGDNGSVSAMSFSPHGRSLAFQTDISSVNLVDTQTWTIKHTFDENNGSNADQSSVSRFVLSVKRVLALAFSASGKVLAGEIEQGGIRLWDPRSGELKNQLGAHDDSVATVDISTNGTSAAEVVDQGSIRLWDLVAFEKKIVATPGESISALALSPDGRTVAIGRADKVALLSTANRELIRTLAVHGRETKYLAFAADGGTLATASEDGTIQTWDLASGQITRTLPGGRITALRFASAGRTLASATEDGSVSLWDLRTGNLSMQLKKHSGAVNAIAFSADGNLMATGSDDRTVIIWETATGKARHTLKGHELAVTSLAFSPDGSLLAAGAGNASVALWEVATGRLNRILK